jgi:protein tyrosine phosphatase
LIFLNRLTKKKTKSTKFFLNFFFSLKDQIQLNPIIDRITSSNALIKWNDVIKIKNNNLNNNNKYYYKLEYNLKLQPNIIDTIDYLNKTEILLTKLKPNSIYNLKLEIINNNNNNDEESEDDDDDIKQIATSSFKTLLNDILEPKGLIVTRYEADKVNVKWDPIVSSTPLKAYRIYFSEFSPTSELTWKPIDKQMTENTQTDINIQELNINKDYAFKVAAIDTSSNEGIESKTEISYKITNGNQQQPVTSSPSPITNKKYQYNEQIGMPQVVEVNEYTSTNVKFSWRPPSSTQLSSRSRLSYLISYSARPKLYKETDGRTKSVPSGNVVYISVPGRDDPTLTITWLVNGLIPDTFYDFNITAIVEDKTQQQQGPGVMKTVKTKRDKPASIGKPLITEIFEDNTVLVQLGNASEINGPISYYWLVVVPNTDATRYQETFERDLTLLAKYSLSNMTSNETAYITAEFETQSWPVKFPIGDGHSYGRFNNRFLVRGLDYKIYTIAFTDEVTTVPNGNRVSLGDALSSDQQPNINSRNSIQLNNNRLIIGDLYSASQYSEIFNTKPIESKPILHDNDYQNILWIAGAISGFIFILILIAIVSLQIMHKKRKHNNLNNNQHQTVVTSSTSSSSPTTQLLINSNQIMTTNSSSSTATTTMNNNNNTLKYTNNTLGLLTTATPIHNNSVNLTPSHHYNSSNHSESLYTSIDASQRQHLLSQHGYTSNYMPNVMSSYDNNASINSFLPPPPPPPPPILSHQTATLLSSTSYDPTELRRLQYQTIGMQTHPPIKCEDLGGYIENLKVNQNEKFSAEYESIEPGQQFQWENSTLDYNRHKNRYANVIAYDHSRVVLNQLYDQIGSDYINANYIDGYRKRNAYIATQGPLPSTFTDFWRMIWEQNTSTIVMMTKLEERNRLKCDQYWPCKGTEVYGNVIQVTLVDYTELATYSIRTLVIARANSNEIKREIKLFQYTAWPENGVPEHPTSVLMFIRRIRNINPVDSGPIVVHCSAGVGRTGCYIVIDTMLERLKYEKSVDIYGHVTCSRSQRNYMIQTEEQYIFCYDAVLEACQSGFTDIPVRNLYSNLEKLLQTIDENCTLTEMELEYKRLTNIKAPQSKFLSANMSANKFKNRLVNILPFEATRVCLAGLNNDIDGTDYINANFIDGYKYKRAYIATQAPLNETIDDFWRMLWEHNSTIIVMLTKLREMGREKCAHYWPSERSIRYGCFVVDPIAEYNMSQYILREFKVTDARDGQSRTIRQFQYVDWPEQGVPKSGESIIELIGQVHKTKEQFGQVGPITVHCSAGVGRTGVFITLSVVLERMRYEGLIDVFNTVKMLRTQRPAMVQTEDQYQFCYRAALEYLGSFDNYET